MIFNIILLFSITTIIANGEQKECTNLNNQNIFRTELCGSLLFPEDTYFEANAKQYAYYSVPNHFAQSILLIAECDKDISMILDFDYQCDYKISLRSGGHQFTGLSSCNSNEYNCIQIILKNYNELTIFKHNKTAIAQVGISLETLFVELDENDLFIPAGAESSVALGGHCQTGGVGYLMIWNGGGPGNWGVILKLYMNVLSNEDYPNVVGVTYLWMYEKEVAEQTGITWLELNNNRDWDSFGYDNILKPFLDLNISDPIVKTIIKNSSVSSLVANEFLIPSVLVPEYRYSMRAHGTTQIWTEDYIYDTLINNDVNQIGVNIKIGFEVLIEEYGTAVSDNSIFNRDVDSTSLAWRDLEQGMGIRIFYKDDNAGEIQSQWQEDSWKHWLSVDAFYNNEDMRYYGYSYVTNEEGEFNMSEQWKDRYNKLKEIKQSIDPCDIFHFAFFSFPHISILFNI